VNFPNFDTFCRNCVSGGILLPDENMT
jgi:hypothetical protein